MPTDENIIEFCEREEAELVDAIERHFAGRRVSSAVEYEGKTYPIIHEGPTEAEREAFRAGIEWAIWCDAMREDEA